MPHWESAKHFYYNETPSYQQLPQLGNEKTYSKLLYLPDYLVRSRELDNLGSYEKHKLTPSRFTEELWISPVLSYNKQRSTRKNEMPATTFNNGIYKRKFEYLDLVMRNENKYHLLQYIMQGKMQGKRNLGKRRIFWLANFHEWYLRSLLWTVRMYYQ